MRIQIRNTLSKYWHTGMLLAAWRQPVEIHYTIIHARMQLTFNDIRVSEQAMTYRYRTISSRNLEATSGNILCNIIVVWSSPLTIYLSKYWHMLLAAWRQPVVGGHASARQIWSVVYTHNSSTTFQQLSTLVDRNMWQKLMRVWHKTFRLISFNFDAKKWIFGEKKEEKQFLVQP
jgi:hypothetical protein